VTAVLTRRTWTVQDVEAVAQRHDAQGRWGKDDQSGAVNLVSSAKVAAAAQCVRTGDLISLALPMDGNGPMRGRNGRVNPQHMMLLTGTDIPADNPPISGFTDDAMYTPLQAGTQWDALSHVFFRGRGYNGSTASSVTSGGAQRNGIQHLVPRSVGRGVLLDLPRWLGVPWLEPGDAIQGDDLAACVEHQGVVVGEGDFVLIRTGQIAQCRDAGTWGSYAGGSAPGLGLTAADFICDRRVAAVACDTWGLEVLPYETEDVLAPLHMVLLAHAGVHIGEMWDLEELAVAAAADGHYDMLLAAVPLPITGAVGSPVSPVAIR
jgi:kynurenine formamidase